MYCSAACRQRAYRSRQAPPSGDTIRALISDIERRVHGLAPHQPDAFYTDVSELASSVGRLRQIARVAVAAGQEEAPDPEQDDVRDEWTFAGLVEPHHRELHVHCYRMLGSYDDAEDLVAEVFLRAWRGRDGFTGRATLRTWLYGIATNACLDFLHTANRRPQRYEPLREFDSGATEGPARITWLQPCPDHLLDQGPAPDLAPVSRETVELVFVTAVQHLPPRQRAVVLLRDVLDWPTAKTAAQLEMTAASVNSALQRARSTLRKYLPERRIDWTGPTTVPNEEERDVLARYLTVVETGDLEVLGELLAADATLTMPPAPLWFVGRDAVLTYLSASLDPCSPAFLGARRAVPTSANRQPGAGVYVRRPGTSVFRAQVIDVLRIDGGRIVEITSFEPHLFSAFGLPLTLGH